MKKLILAAFVSLTFMSCSKEEIEQNDASFLEANATTETCSTLAGPDNSIDLTIAQIDANYNSVSRLKTLFNSLLSKNVRNTGQWSPSIEDLAMRYVNASNKYGAYTSSYIVTKGDCTDSADITVNVVPECNVNAGADNTSTVLTLSEVENNYNSISRLRVLYKSLISDGVNTDGTFNPTIEELASRYTNAQDKTGVYATTYTVGSGKCTDSAELAVTVVKDKCSVNAGPDNSISLTTSQIQTHYYSVSRLKVLFNKLLGEGVSRQGTWSPSIEELAKRYVNASDKTGTYTSTYTLTSGACTDTADISIVVTQ
jgi:hypothetical protein